MWRFRGAMSSCLRLVIRQSISASALMVQQKLKTYPSWPLSTGNLVIFEDSTAVKSALRNQVNAVDMASSQLIVAERVSMSLNNTTNMRLSVLASAPSGVPSRISMEIVAPLTISLQQKQYLAIQFRSM